MYSVLVLGYLDLYQSPRGAALHGITRYLLLYEERISVILNVILDTPGVNPRLVNPSPESRPPGAVSAWYYYILYENLNLLQSPWGATLCGNSISGVSVLLHSPRGAALCGNSISGVSVSIWIYFVRGNLGILDIYYMYNFTSPRGAALHGNSISGVEVILNVLLDSPRGAALHGNSISGVEHIFNSSLYENLNIFRTPGVNPRLVLLHTPSVNPRLNPSVNSLAIKSSQSWYLYGFTLYKKRIQNPSVNSLAIKSSQSWYLYGFTLYEKRIQNPSVNSLAIKSSQSWYLYGFTLCKGLRYYYILYENIDVISDPGANPRLVLLDFYFLDTSTYIRAPVVQPCMVILDSSRGAALHGNSISGVSSPRGAALHGNSISGVSSPRGAALRGNSISGVSGLLDSSRGAALHGNSISGVSYYVYEDLDVFSDPGANLPLGKSFFGVSIPPISTPLSKSISGVSVSIWIYFYYVYEDLDLCQNPPGSTPLSKSISGVSVLLNSSRGAALHGITTYPWNQPLLGNSNSGVSVLLDSPRGAALHVNQPPAEPFFVRGGDLGITRCNTKFYMRPLTYQKPPGQPPTWYICLRSLGIYMDLLCARGFRYYIPPVSTSHLTPGVNPPGNTRYPRVNNCMIPESTSAWSTYLQSLGISMDLLCMRGFRYTTYSGGATLLSKCQPPHGITRCKKFPFRPLSGIGAVGGIKRKVHGGGKNAKGPRSQPPAWTIYFWSLGIYMDLLCARRRFRYTAYPRGATPLSKSISAICLGIEIKLETVVKGSISVRDISACSFGKYDLAEFPHEIQLHYM
ncbi:hypothetical protein BDZ91DRAFT_766838 [Kalaharituber pfeilii]|nr:hypothetical protein BDZ91DRAFT_766838 [Kalaharituber pfeilii]